MLQNVHLILLPTAVSRVACAVHVSASLSHDSAERCIQPEVLVCLQRQQVVDPFDEVFGSRGSSPDRQPRQQAEPDSPGVSSALTIAGWRSKLLLSQRGPAAKSQQEA